MIGELEVHDVHGYNAADICVRRISGKMEGISVTEIIISVVGDGYAQGVLDAENAEAERYPVGSRTSGGVAWSTNQRMALTVSR